MRSSVLVAFAMTSGPGIGVEPLVGVVWTSCRTGAEAPMIAILPRNSPRGNCPRNTFQWEIEEIVPVGPA